MLTQNWLLFSSFTLVHSLMSSQLLFAPPRHFASFIYSVTIVNCSCYLLMTISVSWVIWPVKTHPHMTYNVFGGTLSLTQSINASFIYSVTTEELINDILIVLVTNLWQLMLVITTDTDRSASATARLVSRWLAVADHWARQQRHFVLWQTHHTAVSLATTQHHHSCSLLYCIQGNSAFHPSGVGKRVPASAGKAKAGMVHSVSGWTRGVQVKLWDPLRTRAIPQRLRGVFTTRRYTNPPLPLPIVYCRYNVWDPYSRVLQLCIVISTLV